MEAELYPLNKTGWLFYLLGGIVIIGVISGSVLAVLHPDWSLWENIVFRQGMGTYAASLPFWKMLTYNTCAALLWMMILAALGISMYGMPASSVVLLFRGMAIGALLSMLYVQQGIAGILTAVLFVVPYAISGTLLLLIAARESMRLSWTIIRNVCIGKQKSEVSGKLYCIRFIVLALLLFVFNLLQCVWLHTGFPLFLSFMTKET
jgi:hypothetical protein